MATRRSLRIDGASLALLAAKGLRPVMGQDGEGPTLSLVQQIAAEQAERNQALSGQFAGLIGNTRVYEEGQENEILRVADQSGRYPEMITVNFGVNPQTSGPNVKAFSSSAVVDATLQWGTGGGTTTAIVTIRRGLSVTLAASSLAVKISRRRSAGAPCPPVSVSCFAAYGSRPNTTNETGPVYESDLAYDGSTPIVLEAAAFSSNLSLEEPAYQALYPAVVTFRDYLNAVISVRTPRNVDEGQMMYIPAGCSNILIAPGGSAPAIFRAVQVVSL